MRRFPFLYCCLLFFCTSACAQGSKVRIASVLLTQEKSGWRVDFPDSTAKKYALQTGDLLTAIGAKNASNMGPLAIAAAFNAAFIRAVPLTLERGGGVQKINLWRGDGTPPPPKPVPQSLVSAAEEAPDFTLPTLSNVSVRLSSQRGRWVLLSFWATWCAPCNEEALLLNRLAKAYPQRLTVLALAVKDTRRNLNAFARRLRPAYTILDAGPFRSQLALAYGVGTLSEGGSVPVNVLVRPDGTIAYVQFGYKAPSHLEEEVIDAVGGK